MVLIHGDDNGLVLPPPVAAVQVLLWARIDKHFDSIFTLVLHLR